MAEIRNSKWPPEGCFWLIDQCKMIHLSLDYHGDYIIVFTLCEHAVKNENAIRMKSEIQDGRQGFIIDDKMAILSVDLSW